MSEVVTRLIEGCARITWRAWPGAPHVSIGVRPLPEPAWLAAMDEARSRVRAGDGKEAAYLRAKAERREIIARCIVARDGDVIAPLLGIHEVDLIDDATCETLFRAVIDARDEAHGFAEFARTDDVLEEIDRVYDRKKMHGLVMRLRAKRAGLCGFYGVTSARDLTDWQVLIHARLTRDEDA